jgi:IS30 family transposase
MERDTSTPKQIEILERRDKVAYLLAMNLTEVQIAKQLGVSRETIVGDVHWLKANSLGWLDDQARQGFIFKCKLAMEALEDTNRQLNKMIQDTSDEHGNVKNPQLRMRLLRQRDENLALQIQLLGEGPTLMSLNKIVSDHTSGKRNVDLNNLQDKIE